MGRLEVTPGRRAQRPHVLELLRRTPLTARLVERDLTLTGGERERELAAPLQVEPTGPRVELPFELLPEALGRPSEPARSRASFRKAAHRSTAVGL